MENVYLVVDKATIDHPTNVKVVRSFLGHFGFEK